MFENSMVLVPGPQRFLRLCKSHWNMGEAQGACGQESLNTSAWSAGMGPQPTLVTGGGGQAP